MESGSALILLLAGCGAGVLNSLAGGGTLLTYPALLEFGLAPTVANATSTVALWPGSLAGYWGFRKHLGSARRWALWLLIPSLVGGLLGAYLLLRTPEKRFAEFAPWLILLATGLFAFKATVFGSSGSIAMVSSPWGVRVGALGVQLLVGIYGGFFGAGIGILMLSLLATLGVEEVHAANGIKNLLAASINSVAAAIFLLEARVALPSAGIVLVGALVGGWIGPHLGFRLGQQGSRWLVVAVGTTVAIHLFLRVH